VPKATTSQNLETGEKVYFLGVVPGMSVDINDGIITGVNLADGSIEVKTVKAPGTSGTPVFDNNENVIGILAYQVDSNGVKPKEATYLVFSLEHATVLSKQVISATRPKCGWLGVCVDLTVAGDDGVVIANIIEGSPAHASSLKPKDRILEYNGQPIRNVRDFSDAFIKTKAGETISIKIIRNNQPMTVGVTLKGR
jgi:S1-C subfamily serine protease